MAVTRDSLVMVRLNPLPASPGEPFIWRQSRADSGARTLTRRSDPFVADLQGTTSHPRIAVPPIAVTSHRIAIAEPYHYSIAVYDGQGNALYFIQRDLPPLRRDSVELQAMRRSLEISLEEEGNSEIRRTTRTKLDTLEREARPHLEMRGLHFDSHGRLWAIGRSGDSTFADVFTDTTFLGRHVLPCRKPGKAVALQGEWLALLCQVPTSEASPVQLQLYRIRNQEASATGRGDAGDTPMAGSPSHQRKLK